MAVSSQQVLEDLLHVLGDIDELVKAQAVKPAPGCAAAEPDPELERKLAAIRTRLDAVKEVIAQAVERRVEAVDGYFRANTWKTVGTAAALAFIAGTLVGRPSRSSRD
jgi:ElaB/YqjD/DUF883 family membrane-anchored ribosome-binding protein